MQSALVGLLKKPFQILVGAISGSGRQIVRNVVACVSEGRHKAGIKPYCVTAKLLDIVKLLDNPFKISYTVSVKVLKGLGINFIKNCAVKPMRVGIHNALSFLFALIFRLSHTVICFYSACCENVCFCCQLYCKRLQTICQGFFNIFLKAYWFKMHFMLFSSME